MCHITTVEIKKQYYYCPQISLRSTFSHNPFPFPSCPWQPLSALPLWILFFCMFHMSGIIEHMDFCIWLLSLSMYSGFILVVECIGTSFLYMVEFYTIICIHHILFIYSSFNENLDCLHFLAIMSNAAINIHIQVFVWMYVFTSLEPIHLQIKLLRHMVIPCLMLWETIKWFPNMTSFFLFSSVMYEGSNFSISLLPLRLSFRL